MSSNENWNNIKRTRQMRLAAVVLVLLAAIIVLLASLRINQVTIEGSTHYTAAQFERLLFPNPVDRNPLLFWFRENTGGSIRVPFVDRYTVRMESFGSVHVIIYEEQIVGYVDQMGTYMYFDRDGNVVESAREEMEDVPRVIGLGGEGKRLRVGEKLPVEDESVLKVVLSVSQFLQSHSILWGGEEQKLVRVIDQIYVDGKANAACILSDLQFYLGGADNMEEKLLLMADILPKLAARRGTVYLDNYSDSIENQSYVFKENILMLTPGVYDVEVFETEAETMTAEELPAPEKEKEEPAAAPEPVKTETSAAEPGGEEPAAPESVQADILPETMQAEQIPETAAQQDPAGSGETEEQNTGDENSGERQTESILPEESEPDWEADAAGGQDDWLE